MKRFFVYFFLLFCTIALWFLLIVPIKAVFFYAKTQNLLPNVFVQEFQGTVWDAQFTNIVLKSAEKNTTWRFDKASWTIFPQGFLAAELQMQLNVQVKHTYLKTQISIDRKKKWTFSATEIKGNLQDVFSLFPLPLFIEPTAEIDLQIKELVINNKVLEKWDSVITLKNLVMNKNNMGDFIAQTQIENQMIKITFNDLNSLFLEIKGKLVVEKNGSYKVHGLIREKEKTPEDIKFFLKALADGGNGYKKFQLEGELKLTPFRLSP